MLKAFIMSFNIIFMILFLIGIGSSEVKSVPKDGQKFFETFSRYDVGDPTPKYGDGFIIGEIKEISQKYLYTDITGYREFKVAFKFPATFIFEFDSAANENVGLGIILIDTKNQHFIAKNDDCCKFGIKLPGNRWVDYSKLWMKYTWNHIKLTNNGHEFKIYINEHFVSSSKTFKNIQFIECKIIAKEFERLVLTNIQIRQFPTQFK